MKYKVVATALVTGLTILVAVTLVTLLGLAMYQSALAEEAMVSAPIPTRELRPTFTPTPIPTPIRQLADRLMVEVALLPESGAPPVASTEGWAGIQITRISIFAAGVYNEPVYLVVPLGTGTWVLAGYAEPAFAPIWEMAVPEGIVASEEANGTVRMWGHRWINQAKTESGVLANLDQVTVGDLVVVQGKNGGLIYLQVTERYDQVPYGDGVMSRLLRSNGEQRLAIYTCSTRYDGFAVVVIAEPQAASSDSTRRPLMM